VEVVESFGRIIILLVEIEALAKAKRLDKFNNNPERLNPKLIKTIEKMLIENIMGKIVIETIGKTANLGDFNIKESLGIK
jgi:hypothetical protein